MEERSKQKERGIRWIRRGREGKKKKRMRERKTDKGRDEERGRKEKDIFPGIPTIKARWSEKKSRPTHLELRMGAKILEFRQTPRGKKFSYLDYF